MFFFLLCQYKRVKLEEWEINLRAHLNHFPESSDPTSLNRQLPPRLSSSYNKLLYKSFISLCPKLNHVLQSLLLQVNDRVINNKRNKQLRLFLQVYVIQRRANAHFAVVFEKQHFLLLILWTKNPLQLIRVVQLLIRLFEKRRSLII